MYSSNDLYNWKNEGTLMVKYEDESHPFYVGRIMDRPHILYNKKTKKFVLWAKIGGLLSKKEGFGNAYFAVCESEHITGPFRLVERVKDIPVGDFDLIQCDDKAYVIFENDPRTEGEEPTKVIKVLLEDGQIAGTTSKSFINSLERFLDCIESDDLDEMEVAQSKSKAGRPYLVFKA